MQHQLLTPETCNIPHVDYRQCPICDGGLAVCELYGEYEAGLENPCTGTKTIAAARVRRLVRSGAGSVGAEEIEQ